MILIAGGRNDPNLAVLIDRIVARELPHLSVLVGQNIQPQVRIDIQREVLELDGARVSPTAYFIRQDVFLYETKDFATAQAHAHNWYQAMRGWAETRSEARLFNRRTTLRENNKLQNLIEAASVGLPVPATIVTNEFAEFTERSDGLIQKPIAGGEYTTLLSELIDREQRTVYGAPRFVQPRLNRPEVRIYRIGPKLLAFELQSPELDYRQTSDVTIRPVPVPDSVAAKLLALCDRLELDFGAADFMLDRDGALTFLEVNSQPMFAAFDRKIDGGVCDAIIDHLMRKDVVQECAKTTISEAESVWQLSQGRPIPIADLPANRG